MQGQSLGLVVQAAWEVLWTQIERGLMEDVSVAGSPTALLLADTVTVVQGWSAGVQLCLTKCCRSNAALAILYLSWEGAHDRQGGHVQGHPGASCELAVVHLVSASDHIAWPAAGLDDDCNKAGSGGAKK